MAEFNLMWPLVRDRFGGGSVAQDQAAWLAKFET
jgi:hypothetical protein